MSDLCQIILETNMNKHSEALSHNALAHPRLHGHNL